MQLKDVFSKVILNKKNNQEMLYSKRKILKKLGYKDVEELLELEVKRKW